MIDVQTLTKHYGGHPAIQDVSFSAQQGEILGLLGPNGAGKTTTMRILTGFMPPTRGRASIAGYDVVEASMDVRQRVGYMPEHVPLYPDMTVRGMVRYLARLRGVQQPQQRADAVLERVGLSERRHALVRSLSKGLRQRLGLAQALVHDPAVVILDEPTIGIDPQQVIEIRQMVRELGQDHTVLFSSHILSEVEQVCDRVVILHQGRVLAEGTPEILSQRRRPGVYLYLALKGGDQATLQSLLATIPGVRDVQIEMEGEGFLLHADEDIREAVTGWLAAHKLTLLEMRPRSVTLEDIFLDYVREAT